MTYNNCTDNESIIDNNNGLSSLCKKTKAKLKKQFSENPLIKDYKIYFFATTLIFILMTLQLYVSQLLGINPETNYADIMLLLEGDMVASIQTIATPWLTYFSAFIYLIGFSLLLTVTFLIFVYRKDSHSLQEFTIAFTLIYLIAYPFYILFPVPVTSSTLPNVQPLLYTLHPVILSIIYICDPMLDNSFPSLHAALSIMTLLMVIKRTDSSLFKLIAIFITISIQFVILYLGIHWITDMIGGILLAVSSYYIATRYRNSIIHTFNTLLLQKTVIEDELQE